MVLFTGQIETQSIAQAAVNFQFITIVAGLNLYCVSFTYWYLSRNIEPSLYTLMLTFLSFGLAFAMSYVVQSRYSIENVRNMIPKFSHEGCGDASPLTTCDISFQGIGSRYVHPVLYASPDISPIVPTVTMLLGILYFTQHSLQMRLKKIKLFWGRKRLLRIVLRFSWLSGNFFLLVMIFINMSGAASDLSLFQASGAIDSNSWGIGQIIGITVWLPPILEFLQLYFSQCALFPLFRSHCS